MTIQVLVWMLSVYLTNHKLYQPCPHSPHLLPNPQLGVVIFMCRCTQIIDRIPIYSSQKVNNLTPPLLHYRRRQIKLFKDENSSGSSILQLPKNVAKNFNFRKRFSSEVRCNPVSLYFIFYAQQFLTTTTPNTLWYTILIKFISIQIIPYLNCW